MLIVYSLIAVVVSAMSIAALTYFEALGYALLCLPLLASVAVFAGAVGRDVSQNGVRRGSLYARRAAR
ncbi:MAG TPA: hypothetical protein VGU45_02010 [Microvirga sp.]|jgi:hypothetical protein|nr:hypothetical protein [Microvirga sp.]